VLVNLLTNATASVDEMLSDSRIEKILPHGSGSLSICFRTASML
jgi:hypothetical protein